MLQQTAGSFQNLLSETAPADNAGCDFTLTFVKQWDTSSERAGRTWIEKKHAIESEADQG